MFKTLKRKKVEEFIIDNRENFYRVAYSYVRNEQDALDILQDAIYKALNSVENLKESKYIKTWFYRIVVNSSIDFLRKNKKYGDLLEIDHLESLESHDKHADIDLKKNLDDLPEKYRIVIVLRFFEDLKIEEIANILDENVNTIKTRLYQGLKKLRIKIENERRGYYE
ncbi:sigma-70 family RNA polymerase sigma factor [Clostridioides mangenotii]|uniref:sigma-70 family RNA polymerase sigma factor n=1 Tax=Metaclostridioides mangenotii TaxID=1540 RepID=UPI001C117DB2|nr:sigma-70 family RNA polymerase sigma factor [Clostridioides mangenotii]MCR1955539.1 sigma-70 family RNA polymerase sigma factor [Clostridioides mangenotii]